jgi:hypothetical protein
MPPALSPVVFFLKKGGVLMEEVILAERMLVFVSDRMAPMSARRPMRSRTMISISAS